MAQWIGSWYASPTKFATRFFAFPFPHVSFDDQTIRMIVHPHATGSQLRLKFSNRYGAQPLTLGRVAVARSIQDGKIDPQTAVEVNFQGLSDVTIPAGEDRDSDPVPLNVDARSDLAVSIYLPAYTETSTWHWTPAQSTYIADGNRTEERDTTHFQTKIDSYYWLTGLDVMTEQENARVMVAFGDSITEGFSASFNANHRWPDFFQDRVQQEYPDRNISVLNAGITGNLITLDGGLVTIDGVDIDITIAGERAPARLPWDVFSQAGVTDVIFLQGINDIFGNFNADLIIAGMKEVATKVHQRNLRISIGTIIPFGDSIYYSEAKECIRQEVNTWIRSQELYDGVIDFDQALADPHMSHRLLPAYDSGDHVHPSDEGLKALADAIPLALLFEEH